MSPINGLYYTNWCNYSQGLYPSSLPLGSITHLMYAFFTIDDSGAVISLDPWADFQMPRLFEFNGAKIQLHGLVEELVLCRKSLMASGQCPFQLVLSIGGWGKDHLFAQMAKSATKMANFVESSFDICRRYGFTGIDIDWEYPKTKAEGLQLLQLLNQLRSRFQTCGLSISIASPAGWDQLLHLDLVLLDKVLDFWNVMAYDFAGSWSAVTAPYSNLYLEGTRMESRSLDVVREYLQRGSLSCDLVIQYYKKSGVPSAKLVLGMPNYGRVFVGTRGLGHSFNTAGSAEYPESTIKLNEIGRKFPKTEFYSNSVFASGFKDGTMVTFDCDRVLKEKARYCVEQGLAGGFFWELSGDFSVEGESHTVQWGCYWEKSRRR